MDPITMTGIRGLQIPPQGSPGGAKPGEFENVLKTFLESTSRQLNAADQKTAEFAVGKRHDIHEIVIASEKAGIHLNLLLNIRNKLVEAYQEIMRIQF